jgi:inner membrane protein
MNTLFPLFGAYFWWIAAAVLLLAEMAMPGFFMIWLAAAAALTAIIGNIFHMEWTAEVLTFAVLAGACVAASWKFVSKSWAVKSDSPHLNQRQAGLVGKSYVLEKAIINGSGKIKVEDTIWDVDGEDASAGSRVKVIGVDGMRLRVQRG